jgi:O-methyltransferase
MPEKIMPHTTTLLEKAIERLKFEYQYVWIYDKYKTYTMISKQIFLANLKLCWIYKVIPGAIVECGVWRGGMIAAISEVLGDQKNYYLFDSFEGLPKARDIDGEAAKNWQADKTGCMYYNNCTAEISYAEQAMKLSGCNNYKLIKGWFVDTLPNYDFPEAIAILRLDADWYESTMQCLKSLYPKVIQGGLIILDDYYTWDGCSRALHDYLSINKMTERIYQIPGDCNCYIIKK